MKNSTIIKRDLKTFVIVSLAIGLFIILFSLIGHMLTPGKLIPSSFLGGIIGLLIGIYICFRQNYISKEGLLPVLLCSLFAFGLVSFIIVFNFDKPLFIFFCFLLLGLTLLISNHYFSVRRDFSRDKFYGIMGLLLSCPALYFIIASIVKFQLGVGFLFHPVDRLISQPNGQTNFNAITPFLFV